MREILLRSLRESDLDGVRRVVARSAQHDGVPREVTLEELREDLDVPYVELGADTRVAEVDGTLAGWAWVWNPPSAERLERAYVFGEVDPAWRGLGVGRALLTWGRDRAVERLASRDHDLPRYLRVDAYEWVEATHRLYARLGFRPVRWFEELIRPLSDLPAVVVPDGIELVPWPEARDEELREVRNAAFADHWGTSPMAPESWALALRGHGARTDLSMAAVVAGTDEVVGLCLNHAYPEDDELTGRREAWIENVATLAAHRRRGLASAMIATSLERFADAGFTHALLGVDSDNPTGAARLYRDLGFVTERRSVTYEIEVERAPSPGSGSAQRVKGGEDCRGPRPGGPPWGETAGSAG